MATLLTLVPDSPAPALVLPPADNVPQVDISYSSLRRLVFNLRDTLRTQLGVQKGDVIAMSIVNSVEFVVGFIATGAASVVIVDKFSAGRFWRDFTSTKATWYTAVPTIHSILLNTPLPNPLPKIRFIRSCSSSLSPTVFKRLEETFKAPVLEAYAMTEAAHQMVQKILERTSNDFLSRIPGTVGVGQGVEISIRDDKGRELPLGERGEVCIRGENVTQGYWANEKANKESFWEGRWFRTGDQGFKQQAFPHHVELTGRIKELINRGGEKISPLEVDSALLSVDGVKEAVCFGVEDEKYGEIVWAAVVLSKPDSGAEKRIQAALAGKISKFKIPQKIITVSEIPKGPTGKISRKNVKEVLAKQFKDDKPKARL
ncbi:hypothetical protein FS837_013058 [Tulasnella sp. UAMH 9824]|nr:hypothetical protein FS837_013058 [Tulasnella sp. UAMH 9824]